MADNISTLSDATFDGRANGAFTHLFLEALREHPGATRSELHRAVTAALKREDFDQRSTLEGPRLSRKATFGELW